jgi:hypothetical protein
MKNELWLCLMLYQFFFDKLKILLKIFDGLPYIIEMMNWIS